MAILNQPTQLSVTEAAQRGVARLIADAENGPGVIVTRRNQPVAAVLSVRHLAEIDRAAADLSDLALVLARSVSAGRRTSVDDVLAAFGHTRQSLAELPDE